MLDDNFDLAISGNQNVYTVFESFEESVIIAKKIVNERKNIECVIYGEGEIKLFYLNPFQE